MGIPKDIVPVAYLCIGYVEHFFDEPELESAGWLKRIPLEDLVYFDQWENKKPGDKLIDEIRKNKNLYKDYQEI
jgi:5,6-dimethylbenzimidazole synthase